MQRSCLTCGRAFIPQSPRQRRCPQHQGSGTGWSHNRDTKAQAAMRAAVLERDGYQCTHVEDGERCTESRPVRLRCCHIKPLADGGSYDPSNGRTLCRAHDKLTDPHAR